ncbi:Ankyrin repeats (3 copies) [Popillia japonica]|uniref:Ankyrin repeats (3 copies) n=1 Tax=Popillia japonica TaxID=7064 RepID=A0AAW1IXC4_POPJA
MSHCGERDHSHENCQIDTKSSNLFQSLNELDFERGIWSAAQSGDLDKVINFLNKGENVDVKDTAGYTALHYAARNGHSDICKCLLARGSDVNAVTKAGLATSLHRACSAGYYNIVKILLEHKADVNLQDSDGKTALHRAASAQNKPICEQLLAVSSDLKFVKDAKDKVPFDYATEETLLDLLKI